MSMIRFELQQAVRTLARNPWHAIVVTLMLAAGLGLSMYMFGAVNAFVLRPLPFPNQHELAHVELQDPKTGRNSIEMPLHEYLDLAAAQKSLAPFAVYTSGTVNLSGDERPERFEGGFVGPGVFETIGILPMLGRTFQPDDYAKGAPGTVIVSHALWEQRWMGEPSALGRMIRVNGKPAQIVGIMPKGYRFPNTDVWTPLDLDVADVPRGQGLTGEVVARLVPGATLDSVAAELDGLLAGIAEEHPDTASKGMRSVVKPLAVEYVGNNTPKVLAAMMIAVLFVLLIACANVANLLIARTAERGRELAIHAALGAARGRLIGRMVAEGLVVCAVGGAIGLMLAQWLGALTMRTLREGEGLPYWMNYALDWRSVAFALGVAVFAALAATLIPALRAGRVSPALAMRDGGWGSSAAAAGRLSRIMVAGQIAMCAVLLVLAGLTVQSILAMQSIDTGADVDDVISGRIVLFEEAYPEDAKALQFFETLEQRLKALPGVESAALTDSVPLTFATGTYYLKEGDAPPEDGRHAFASYVTTTPSYFDTFRIAARKGRLYDARDDANAPKVAVINEALAQRLFPDGDAIGKRLDLNPQKTDDVPVEIVGVVPTVLQQEPDEDFHDVVYVPLAQHPTRYMSMALRTGGDPLAYAGALRETVQAMDPDLPVYFLRTVEQWIETATVADRLLARLFSLFAFFGVLLAGAGIYALLAFGVAARTREIGVRRALGAENRGIVRMVMRQGIVQLAVGLGLGLVLAVACAQILSNILFGVQPFDVPTLFGVAVTLSLVVLVASFVPARRALRIEPIQALRYE